LKRRFGFATLVVAAVVAAVVLSTRRGQGTLGKKKLLLLEYDEGIGKGRLNIKK